MTMWNPMYGVKLATRVSLLYPRRHGNHRRGITTPFIVADQAGLDM